MNILVAGGAGFIGSHLCDSLIQNNNIIVVDKLIFGKKYIEHLLSNEEYDNNRFKFYEMELSNQNELDKIFEINNIDIVYHLAANSDIQKGGKNPNIDFQDTFMTTRTILESMRKYNVKRLFFASTSAVYGEMVDTELTEMTGGIKPISYYGGGKLASEAIISSYTHMCDMETIVFRFPNVIGPRLTHGVIFDFVKKLRINSSKLEILGDGKQCKPYIYVHDLIEAIVLMTGEIKNGMEIYNVGVESEGTEVRKIAEIVVEVMGYKNVEMIYTGGDRGWKGDVPKFQYNISKILSKGWKPQYTSDEAIRKTVEYIMKLES